MEENKIIFTAEELKDQGIVSGDYVIKKLKYHPADIIFLLDAGKIQAYRRFSIPGTSFQQKAEYRMLRHYEPKTLTDEKVPGLFFSRKEIENLDAREAGRKATNYDEFDKYAVYLKKENHRLTKKEIIEKSGYLYPNREMVTDGTIIKHLNKLFVEHNIEHKDKPGRPKNRT